MKVFVYGKNSDDKGMQLEVLTAAILKNMGFTVSRNEIGSGGNELDVVATRQEPYGGESKLICECKAYNSLISINEWLKFLGKLYLEQRKNQMTHGLMIALSGANGNVLGSYNDIKSGNYITLITNENLYTKIAEIHPMMSEQQVTATISQYSRKDIVDVNIIYYDALYYWHICFPNGEYTILKDDLTNSDEEVLNPFKEMIESQTSSRLYVDIKKEQEAIQRRSFIRSLVLSYTLDQDRTLKDTIEWVNSVREGFNVSQAEVEEEIAAIPYLKVSEESMISLIDVTEIDFIDFYRFVLKDTVSTKVMATTFYKEHINKALLEEICKLQGGIQIPEENVDECLFLLKHSPTALLYSIYADEAITRYRGNGKAIFPNVEKAHTEWYMDNVMRGFISDYNKQSLSEYYFATEKIPSIEIHTNLKIFKDGEEPREIHHYKAECLGRLGEEYGNQVALIIKIPE